MKLFQNSKLCPNAFVKYDGKKLTKAQQAVNKRLGLGSSSSKWAGRYYCQLTQGLCLGECNEQEVKR